MEDVFVLKYLTIVDDAATEAVACDVRRRPIVDKPDAAQSTFAIGEPGPPRSTPDYYPLQVVNTTLGQLSRSRLMANIREQKGWSYDVRSDFGFGA
jgi:predicted Zn-dependent peptidase